MNFPLSLVYQKGRGGSIKQAQAWYFLFLLILKFGIKLAHYWSNQEGFILS